MIRDILYPKPLEFKFIQDSYYFVAVMAGISVIGYIISIPKFVEYGFSTKNIVFRSLDLITIAVPPSLPAILASSVAFSIKRLKKQKVFCIQPGRVNICGRVETFVFDKTGTLTEDGLKVIGHQTMSDQDKLFDKFQNVL
jgi:cation-transporting ATPase 13A2